jgi:hypothetical protein
MLNVMSQMNKEYQEWKDQFKTQFYSIRQFVFRDSYGELLEQFNQLLIAMNLKVTEDNVETEVTEEESQ